MRCDKGFGLRVTAETVLRCLNGQEMNTFERSDVYFIALLFSIVFVDFEHRNRTLFCIVYTHHLLQHVNDLAKRWLRGLFRV